MGVLVFFMDCSAILRTVPIMYVYSANGCSQLAVRYSSRHRKESTVVRHVYSACNVSRQHCKHAGHLPSHFQSAPLCPQKVHKIISITSNMLHQNTDDIMPTIICPHSLSLPAGGSNDKQALIFSFPPCCNSMSLALCSADLVKILLVVAVYLVLGG